jgi:hypothetical protein
MAESIKRKLQRMIAKKDKIIGAVYAHGSHDDRFLDCLAKAPQALRDHYRMTREACDQLEREAVNTGKAWRNTLGSLTFYR